VSARALLIFKPDAAHRIAVRSAIWSWLDQRDDIRILGLDWYRAPAELIKRHYDFLQDRPFFPWLVDFMTALPVIAGAVEADDLEKVRYDLGETQIQNSRPGSLRERYGIYAGVNCLHLSDGPETGETETELWSRYVDLEGGVHADALDEGFDRRDHTYQLRSLAAQYAAGLHRELAAEAIVGLLREETALTEADFRALQRIILDAFD
jgi:nucleoside-diphosphate kinase